MAGIDTIDVATRRYIRQNSKKLVDSVFHASPIFDWTARMKQAREEAIVDLIASGAATSYADAAIAVDTAAAMADDDPLSGLLALSSTPRP